VCDAHVLRSPESKIDPDIPKSDQDLNLEAQGLKGSQVPLILFEKRYGVRMPWLRAPTAGHLRPLQT